MSDPTLEALGGLPMPAQPDTRWPPLDLDRHTDDVRIVDTFDETYQPPQPAPASSEPEPPARLRHRQTWEERHRQDIDDIRLSLSRCQTALRDAAEGCRAINYWPEVAGSINAALDRTVEALRLIDIHDPE